MSEEVKPPQPLPEGTQIVEVTATTKGKLTTVLQDSRAWNHKAPLWLTIMVDTLVSFNSGLAGFEATQSGHNHTIKTIILACSISNLFFMSLKKAIGVVPNS